MKIKQRLLSLCFACSFVITTASFVAAQTGGGFDLSHNVIASGGGSNSAGGSFKVEGTIGQGAAGTNSIGGSFQLRGGFWAFQQLAPTAATVTLSGRVLSQDGEGFISNVRIYLIDTFTGVEKTAQTNPFGYYKFEELEVGHLYVIRAVHKIFTFTPDSYHFELLENREDINFSAIELTKY